MALSTPVDSAIGATGVAANDFDNKKDMVLLQVYNLNNVASSIYSNNNSRSWEPMGQPLVFESNGEHPVDFSGEGTSMAVVTPSRTVRILTFEEEQNKWILQYELPMDTSYDDFSEELFIISSVSLSEDATVLAVKWRNVQDYCSDSVALYKCNNENDVENDSVTTATWNLMAVQEEGLAYDQEAIQTMELSKDGGTLALVLFNTITLDTRLRFHKLNSELGNHEWETGYMTDWNTAESETKEWVQAGDDLVLHSDEMIADPDVSISYSGLYVAVALPQGFVKIFCYIESYDNDTAVLGSWIPCGEIQAMASVNITNITRTMRSSIDMSSDGDGIVVGTVPVEVGTDDDVFHGMVEYFYYDYSSYYDLHTWLALREPLESGANGTTAGQFFGGRVALSTPDSEPVLVVGTGNDSHTGQGEVYWYEGETWGGGYWL